MNTHLLSSSFAFYFAFLRIVCFSSDNLKYCRADNIIGYSTNVIATKDKRVAAQSPSSAPRVTDDPVRNVVDRAVADDRHGVIRAEQSCVYSWVTEHAAPLDSQILRNFNK